MKRARFVCIDFKSLTKVQDISKYVRLFIKWNMMVMLLWLRIFVFAFGIAVISAETIDDVKQNVEKTIHEAVEFINNLTEKGPQSGTLNGLLTRNSVDAIYKKGFYEGLLKEFEVIKNNTMKDLHNRLEKLKKRLEYTKKFGPNKEDELRIAWYRVKKSNNFLRKHLDKHYLKVNNFYKKYNEVIDKTSKAHYELKQWGSLWH